MTSRQTAFGSSSKSKNKGKSKRVINQQQVISRHHNMAISERPPAFSLSIRCSRRVGVYRQDFIDRVTLLLKAVRNITVDILDSDGPGVDCISASLNSIDSITQLSSALSSHGRSAEAEALQNAVAKCLEKKPFGGLGLDSSIELADADRDEALFFVEAWLETLNSQARARKTPLPQSVRLEKTRSMTLTEKIFAHHVVGGTSIEGLKQGELARVAVDWIISSDISWNGMRKILEKIGETEIWRNDRLWIAGDHMVEPRTKDHPRVQLLFQVAEAAQKKHKMTEYQGMNYTIMHTEFVRQRAQPGMITLGSDSHTCSAGAVGGLAIGLGVTDVSIAVATGETWFKIPEAILIYFTGKPTFGMTGKDVILYILGELKRNTVGANRIVEFDGPGLQWLSIDARFAICNMCTEFGAITGIFVPDAITQDYVSGRKLKVNRSNSVYFKPDKDAVYAGKYEIDLSKVESTVAVYPKPDDVVPVSQRAGIHLDGVFIGACTTTEEELVLGALVLQVGLREKLPIKPGKRRVTPGSLPIVEKLRSLGLLDVYEAAGFTTGVPGCSYCIAMAADQAAPGEVWLSSQNRNFKNRMGPGSFGSITSAATVAASSFGMEITDPRPFLEKIDSEFFKKHTKYAAEPSKTTRVVYVEPRVGQLEVSKPLVVSDNKARSEDSQMTGGSQEQPELPVIIKSRIKVLEDFIDTDALIPSNWMALGLSDIEVGTHCLEYTHPEFRRQAKNGQQVIVAGKAFGCGSSREQAVNALKGNGVKAVIARSFAFIYSRNQPSLGLVGITMDDDDFYAAAVENESIEINIPARQIIVGGDKIFKFQMSEMEWRLTASHGLSEAYKKFGRLIWENLTIPDGTEGKTDNAVEMSEESTDNLLRW